MCQKSHFILFFLLEVPSAPPQLYIASTSRTDIKVKWHPLSSEQSRGVVTHYRIEYSILDQRKCPNISCTEKTRNTSS